MQRIVIAGASGHAGVVIDIVENMGCEIAGLIDTYRPKGPFRGYSILGTEADLPRLAAEHRLDGLVIAIGDNWVRFQFWERMQGLPGGGLPLVSAIHPSAQIGRDVVIGPGSVVMAGVIVNTGAKIGVNCILNTNCSVDHDSVLGDFSSLGPGATTGGNVRIGKFSAVALGANVIHGIAIGEHTVVGAGSTVVRNLPDGVVAYGSPARVVRERAAGEKYL